VREIRCGVLELAIALEHCRHEYPRVRDFHGRSSPAENKVGRTETQIAPGDEGESDDVKGPIVRDRDAD
jgi:hypothetical protein